MKKFIYMNCSKCGGKLEWNEDANFYDMFLVKPCEHCTGITEKEIDLLESCVFTTEAEGYNVDEDKKVISKLRATQK